MGVTGTGMRVSNGSVNSGKVYDWRIKAYCYWQVVLTRGMEGPFVVRIERCVKRNNDRRRYRCCGKPVRLSYIRFSRVVQTIEICVCHICWYTHSPFNHLLPSGNVIHNGSLGRVTVCNGSGSNKMYAQNAGLRQWRNGRNARVRSSQTSSSKDVGQIVTIH